MLFNNNLKRAKHNYLFFLSIHIVISALVITSLAGIMASHFPNYATKAYLTEALTKISVARTEITTDYYQLGHWPEAQTLEKNSDDGGIIDQITFDGKGTINVIFNNQKPILSNRILSFTAAHLPNIDSSGILWICGYASLPEGFKTMGVNITKIEPNKLPNSCKR